MCACVMSGGGVYCTMLYMYVGRVHGTALGTTYGNQPTLARLVSANLLYKKIVIFSLSFNSNGFLRRKGVCNVR